MTEDTLKKAREEFEKIYRHRDLTRRSHGYVSESLNDQWYSFEEGWNAAMNSPQPVTSAEMDAKWDKIEEGLSQLKNENNRGRINDGWANIHCVLEDVQSLRAALSTSIEAGNEQAEVAKVLADIREARTIIIFEAAKLAAAQELPSHHRVDYKRHVPTWMLNALEALHGRMGANANHLKKVVDFLDKAERTITAATKARVQFSQCTVCGKEIPFAKFIGDRQCEKHK